MSIDGVGKTAEYIRHGMDWKNVEQNIYKFTVLPKTIYFNTAISSYVLLDVSNFAKFLMKLQGMNDKIRSKCYTVIGPKQLHFLNLYGDLRKRAINEINEAVEVLTADNFNIFKKELLDIKTNLESSEIRDPISFIKYTQNLDKLRNESFEDTFGIKLF
jgi:hypothetical protein